MDTSKFTLANILISLAITLVSYMIYPWVRVVIFGKRYTKEEAKKMALWNSIIVGGIYFILTVIFYGGSVWSMAPSLLYYCINRSIWVSGDDSSKTETVKDMNKYSKCKKCGIVYSASVGECPQCSKEHSDNVESIKDDDVFDEEKYKNLRNLKKLLDDKIITKEEFEKEKKKILK